MKKSILLLSFLLSGCIFMEWERCGSLSGWCNPGDKIVPSLDYKLPKNKMNFETDNTGKLTTKGSKDYIALQTKDFNSCGLSSGDSFVLEEEGVNKYLCVEKKGWYMEKGSVCEMEFYWDYPECVAWRKKYSKPDVKPWKFGIDK